MPSLINDLGELQLTVLNVLWNRAPLTVHETLEALPADRKLAYTTVLTVLRNLEKRGLLTHEMEPGTRMYRYSPLISESEARREALIDFLERQFAGSPLSLIAHLLETIPLDADELNQIGEMIAAHGAQFNGNSAS